MTRLQRISANLFNAWWLAEQQFPETVFDTITTRISELEAKNRGDIVFALEARLALKGVARGFTPRQRAEKVFAELEVWDTEDNAGVLIYVLLAEHAIEIVADRGIARLVPQARWDGICAAASSAFSRNAFEAGAVAAIESVSDLLQEFMPTLPGQARKNELSDQPVLL
jgi:uncharacterized membrane protein